VTDNSAPDAQRHARAERLAVLTRLAATFQRGLILGAAGSFFTLSEMILVSCITC
jgi:hypothetical protein